MRWVEISDSSERIRMTTLSQALTKFGIENEVSFLEADRQSFPEVLARAQKDFDQIRIGGSLCTEVMDCVVNFTMLPKQIGAADALVKIDGKWWPRNFLAEGIHRAVIADVPQLDIGGAVFIIGANWRATAAVSAFSKAGFQTFTIADVNVAEGEAYVQKLRRTYFDVRFQFVTRQAVTQLPSVHSVALNTLKRGEDQGLLDELIYFNYLKLGGVWLDLPLLPTKEVAGGSIAEEADAAGAFVEPPVKVAASVDRNWAEACIHSAGFQFDRAAYRSLLSKALRARAEES